MTLAALLLAALLAAPAPAAPAGATLVVRARGLDDAALQRALRPRAGGAPVVLLRHVASVDPDHTFIDLDLDPPDLAITIILRDGRVYVRRAPAPDSPRDIARLVASMLVAIDDDDLAPLPERATSPALAGTSDMSERTADTPLAVSVDLRESAPVSPSSRPAAAIKKDMSLGTSSPDRPDRPDPTGRPVRPRIELGLAAAPVLGLGVPRQGGAGLRGGGGELRLDLRGARVWLVSAGMRAVGDVAAHAGPADPGERFGLARIRLSLGVGVWLRRARFDLRAVASASVEPWFVTHRLRRVRLGESASPAPLLGGHLKLIFAPALTRSARLHLGIFAELAISGAASGRAVEVRRQTTQLFALGGLEAGLGLELRACLCPITHKPSKSPAAR